MAIYNSQAVGLNNVKRAVELIHPDLLEIGSLITNKIFEELGWSTLEAVQNKDVIYTYGGNEAVASQYQPGKIINASLGDITPRELQVRNVATNIYDNLQLYREYIPFDILGISDGGGLNTPETEKRLRQIAKRFADHIYRNLVAGDYSLGVGNAYGLYNGLNALIKADITAGNVSSTKGNLQLLDTLDLTDNDDDSKVAAYEAFDAFVLGMDEDLQDADQVNIMMSKKMAQFITQGAALKFNSAIQNAIMTTNDGVRFFDRQNIVLKPTKVMGIGQQMVAYTPGNITFATDLSRVGDPESAFMNVDTVQGDPNILDFFMQVAVGMRIDIADSTNFCVGLDKTSNGTYNTFKTLKGTVAINDATDFDESQVDVTKLDVTKLDLSKLSTAQVTALKTKLGIE